MKLGTRDQSKQNKCKMDGGPVLSSLDDSLTSNSSYDGADLGMGDLEGQQGRKSRHVSSSTVDSGVQEELPAVVPINVGGHRFMTRLSTLCKYGDSMLAAMFSGRHKLDKDRNGYYFIDSNGTYFGFILDYLRHENLPPNEAALHVYRDACYYNISPLVERLKMTPVVAQMIVRDNHRAQFPNYNRVKGNVIKAAITNATNDQIGVVIIHAFRETFVPKATAFDPNHKCLVEQAHMSVGPWNSPADEDALIRCLVQDLNEEGFHVKSQEQRRRCKYYHGQNCERCIYKITIIFQ